MVQKNFTKVFLSQTTKINKSSCGPHIVNESLQKNLKSIRLTILILFDCFMFGLVGGSVSVEINRDI